MKKTFVLDTNVLLTDADSIFHFEDNDILLPLKVLEEIDKKKRQMDSVGANARRIARLLDEFREYGSLADGVPLGGDEKGTIRIYDSNKSLLPEGLTTSDSDNLILSTALKFQVDNPDEVVVIVSHDINLRVRCDALKIKCEPFYEDKVVDDAKLIYQGYTKIIVAHDIVEDVYNQREIFAEDSWGDFFPNQFILLTSDMDGKKTAPVRFIGKDKPLVRMTDYAKNGGLQKGRIKPKNKEQQFALNLLMDPNVKVVTLLGLPGSGKTLISLASALEQSSIKSFKEDPSNQDKPLYEKVLVSRPIMPMGKDIGFLPGDLTAKLSPYLSPITDNLEFILKERKDISEYQDAGLLEIEALTFIRGRSIANAFMIIDEAQNLTPHEVKTILTRVGEGTKIVFTGDVEQIDNPYLDATTNGLSYLIEKFKEVSFSGHITLIKGHRSEVATIASKLL